VQVLFGFLLALPFTTQFVRLGPGQRRLYMADVVQAAASIARVPPRSETPLWRIETGAVHLHG
jgi:hypothetical protein